MTAIQKVKFMNNLAELIESSAFINAVKASPSGEFLLKFFTECAEKKIDEMMSGDAKQTEQSANNLLKLLSNIHSAMSEFKGMVNAFHSTPLVVTLENLNDKLSGVSSGIKEQQRSSVSSPSEHQRLQEYKIDVNSEDREAARNHLKEKGKILRDEMY
jgi:hypothetical protein